MEDGAGLRGERMIPDDVFPGILSWRRGWMRTQNQKLESPTLRDAVRPLTSQRRVALGLPRGLTVLVTDDRSMGEMGGMHGEHPGCPVEVLEIAP